MTSEELAELVRFVHDTRKPLNRISMQAELIKLALEGAIPQEKAIEALDKIILASKDTSEELASMVEHFTSPDEKHL